MTLVCKDIGTVRLNYKKDIVGTELTEFYRHIKLINNYDYIDRCNYKLDEDGKAYYETKRGKTIDKWYIINEDE